MPIRFDERPNSRESGEVPPTTTLRFVCQGESNELIVRAYAIAVTPALYAHPSGALLSRQDVQLKPGGHQLWYIDVPYGIKKTESGSFKLSFDTQGGTLHIKASKETLAAYGSGTSVSDHRQAIGVTGPDKDPEGTDIVIPALKITCKFNSPQGALTLAEIRNLARWTGKVNSDNFLGFSPGEVLFLGATGEEGTDQPTTVDYHFGCSENLTGLSVGGITVANKAGHHYAWIQFKPATANNSGTRQPKAVYVERVYDTIPLAACLGFGG